MSTEGDDSYYFVESELLKKHPEIAGLGNLSNLFANRYLRYQIKKQKAPFLASAEASAKAAEQEALAQAALAQADHPNPEQSAFVDAGVEYDEQTLPMSDLLNPKCFREVIKPEEQQLLSFTSQSGERHTAYFGKDRTTEQSKDRCCLFSSKEPGGQLCGPCGPAMNLFFFEVKRWSDNKASEDAVITSANLEKKDAVVSSVSLGANTKN